MSTVEPIHFASLTYPQVAELRAAERQPVLFLPVGATEPHGPHAPLATDVIISEAMCERAARLLAPDPGLRGLVLPTVPYGVTRYARPFPGIVHVEEATLRALIVDALTSLIEQDFRLIVLANSHFEPDHVRTLHEALDAIERDRELTLGFVDLTRRHNARRLTEEFQRGESHADRYETSIVLASRPELVDIEAMAGLPSVSIDMAQGIASGKSTFAELGMARAYVGSPAKATAAEGEATLDVLADLLVEAARALAAGTGGRDRPGLYGSA